MKLSAIQRFTLLDFPGKVACIAFTPGCDLRCGFCHNPEFVLPERLCAISESFISAEHFFRFLEKRQGLLDGVVVSGGEPTAWRDLPDFLDQIRMLGFSVKLDTNGNNPDMIEQLIAGRLVDYIAMDVKTSLERYRDLAGPGVRPEHIKRSISLISGSNIEHEFRTTLIREHHTEPVLAELSRLLEGVCRLYFQAFRPAQTLDPAFAQCHGFSMDEMAGLAKRFQTPERQVSVRG